METLLFALAGPYLFLGVLILSAIRILGHIAVRYWQTGSCAARVNVREMTAHVLQSATLYPFLILIACGVYPGPGLAKAFAEANPVVLGIAGVVGALATLSMDFQSLASGRNSRD